MVSDPWHEQFRQASLKLASQVGPTDAPAPGVLPPAAEVMSQSAAAPSTGLTPVVPEGPPMREDWEREIDDFVARTGLPFEITLRHGSKLRVCDSPRQASDAVEVTLDHFKNLARIAAAFDAKVVHAMTKDQAEAEIRKKIEAREGFWASEHCFVEIDRKAMLDELMARGGRGGDHGVISEPIAPQAPPVVTAAEWLMIPAAAIIEQVPLRVNKKVIGSLIKTARGFYWVRQASPTEHRLYGINAAWASRGGYCIDREVYEKYLAGTPTVIRVVRDKVNFFTTASHIQAHAGLIKSWGTERVVMPLSGNYWLVTNEKGEAIE